jgi:hypothetical protein
MPASPLSPHLINFLFPSYFHLRRPDKRPLCGTRRFQFNIYLPAPPNAPFPWAGVCSSRACSTRRTRNAEASYPTFSLGTPTDESAFHFITYSPRLTASSVEVRSSNRRTAAQSTFHLITYSHWLTPSLEAGVTNALPADFSRPRHRSASLILSSYLIYFQLISTAVVASLRPTSVR